MTLPLDDLALAVASPARDRPIGEFGAEVVVSTPQVDGGARQSNGEWLSDGALGAFATEESLSELAVLVVAPAADDAAIQARAGGL